MRQILLLLALTSPALADPAIVEAVQAEAEGAAWRFDVTLSHGDTGWDDYADGWRVELPNGKVLGTRDLAHPHVDEQPFTRSLSGVELPEGALELRVRASTSTEGWSADAAPYRLTR